MSNIQAGGNFIGCPSLFGVTSGSGGGPPPPGFTWTFDLSAANGNGYLNLLMFG